MSPKARYSLERYFGSSIPAAIRSALSIEGIRPLKTGSHFKVSGERGIFTFLYAEGDIITCFDPNGQFKMVSANKVKRSINRSKRERYKKGGKKTKSP